MERGEGMFRQLSVLAMLGICSYEDLKSRQISVVWLAVFALEGILCCLFSGEGLMAHVITAMVPGLLLFLLSFVSGGGIGQGDGMLLMVAGIFLGGSCVLSILVYAVILSGIYALFLFIVRKKGKKYEIAFVPFLLAAFLVEMLSVFISS